MLYKEINKEDHKISKLMDKLISRAIWYNLQRNFGQPGEIISSLSEEDKEILQNLKPENLSSLRIDLLPIGINENPIYPKNYKFHDKSYQNQDIYKYKERK